MVPALADTITFKADLNGASEVPPTDSTGTAKAEVTVDTATKTPFAGQYIGGLDRP